MSVTLGGAGTEVCVRKPKRAGEGTNRLASKKKPDIWKMALRRKTERDRLARSTGVNRRKRENVGWLGS